MKRFLQALAFFVTVSVIAISISVSIHWLILHPLHAPFFISVLVAIIVGTCAGIIAAESWRTK